MQSRLASHSFFIEVCPFTRAAQITLRVSPFRNKLSSSGLSGNLTRPAVTTGHDVLNRS